VKSCSRYCR